MEKTKVLSQTIFLQTHLALSIFGKVAGAVSAGVKLLAVEALRFLVFKVDMKHAYLILAHHEPEVLRLLLTLLDDARNDIYCILMAEHSVSMNNLSIGNPNRLVSSYCLNV